MSQDRLSPPEEEACLVRLRSSSQKGGTIIAEDVTDRETHERRLCDPDGYRPPFCPRCGATFLHVHDYRERVLRAEPGQPVARTVRHACVGCGAIWQTLPAFIARHLWREMRYSFCRFLEMKLPRSGRAGALLLDGEVALSYYRLDKISEGTIDLQVHEPGGLYGPTEVGTRAAQEHEVPRSQIIDVLNERFGTHFTASDQIAVFDAIRAEAVADEEVIQRAHANELDNFALAFRPKIEGLMLDRMDRNQDIVTRYLNDADFRAVVDQEMARRTYEQIRGQAEAGRAG